VYLFVIAVAVVELILLAACGQPQILYSEDETLPANKAASQHVTLDPTGAAAQEGHDPLAPMTAPKTRP
jgi:hypothetical protein